VKKENLVGLGLILIVLGLLILAFANVPAKAENYVLKAGVDNSQNPFKLSISGYYEAGQIFFFNFTKGSYWGVKYDQENGLEPALTDFSPDTALPAHKIVTFYLHTPSSELSVEVYVVSGTDPFAVVYGNESPDFTPLTGGNLSFINLGVKGTINRSGNYTMEAATIIPLIQRALGDTYTMATDPPQLMRLWNVNLVESTPYFVPFVSLAAVLIVSGAVACVWAFASGRRPGRHLKKTRDR
jgi:hypothetical protein